MSQVSTRENGLSASALESHLWEAANILRGSPVDRTDWKSYILPLLFFRRICDVWDEEHAEMVERIVNDVDEIVRLVRFPGWQQTSAGEREVRRALRKTLFKYKLHQDQELFDKAYGYIRQYY